MTTDALQLHRDAIVIDAVCPLLMNKSFIEWYKEGGATAIAPTVGLSLPSGPTLKGLGGWLRLIDQRDDLVLIRRAADIEQAKREGKLGIIFHFQGTEPIDDELDLVHSWKAAGVGIIQLSYNLKNRIGDGAQERTDAALSYFGLDFVRRCNEARVIVDCSHTGYRTTMEALEASSRPTVFSHANCRAIHDNPRNIRDDQIKAAAATGGLVGTVGFPAFVANSTKPTLDQFIDHIAYIADLVGIDHTGLGIDYYPNMDSASKLEDAQAYYKYSIDNGRWRADAYPPPPHIYPTGIESPRTLENLTVRLAERGFSDNDIRKVLGGNWMRVYREVWGC